jgi:Ser/Thr protein kinase RdoA (MazF antagonist)
MSKFPVTESTLSAHHLGQFLQQRYAFSPNTICKLFRTGMNHLYLVTDGEQKFVLRIYTVNWRTKLAISEELRLLVHLKENNVPVSYPIADPGGNYIQEIDAPEGVRYCVLFSFAAGKKSAKFTAQTSYQIGLAMGRMHKATERFAIDRVSYDTKTLLADPFAVTSSFFTNASDEMDFVERLTKFLTGKYETVDINGVRHGAVHLDIWFDNMHFNGEAEVTIFDFDFCGNGWLCHDVAYFMFQLFYTNPVEEEYKQKAESFLQGYESITPLSDEEKRIIPFTALGVLLFYLGTQCDRYDTWSNIFLNEDHLKRFVAMLKKWMAYTNVQIEG